MNILGVFAIGMNPAACLVQDGKIVSFVEEERFTRLKVSENIFPSNSIKFCLSKSNLTLDSIDKIAFGWDATKYPFTMARNYLSNYVKYKYREMKSFHSKKDNSIFITTIQDLFEYHPSIIRNVISKNLKACGLNGKIPEIEFVPHHMAHAYSVYFCSSFNNAGIITIDGHGEEICSQLLIANEDKIRVVKNFPIPHSLGWFYAAMTEYLGFIPYKDEGKLMGLAAYGESRKDFNRFIEPLSKILKIKSDYYEVDPIYTLFGGHNYGSRYTDEMVKFITSVDSQCKPISYGEKALINGKAINKYLLENYIDLAWAAQKLLENAAIMLGRYLVKEYNVENLCVAGGVALNCKMNGEILRNSGCKNIFVQPASNDAGTAMGAALYVAHKNGEKIRNSLTNVYKGPSYSSDDILKILNQCKVKFQHIDEPSVKAAELLNDGKIIAWFQDEMEFGARALGNRSILANPTYANIKDKVNNEVKYREAWRPFCPSMIEEVKDLYIENPNEASFMIVAYKINSSSNFPCITHVDGTIRPQLVSKKTNEKFHSLIANLGKKTGHPVVLNTSFNVRGEPIICNPLEAIRCFYSNGLDALIMDHFLLTKE